MENIKLILKGIIIGIAKIIPGISGSMIAISLNVYENAIKAINDIKNIRNIYFLVKLSLGILIGILLFGNIVRYFYNNYYFYTMCLFIGLIIGTIPSIIKRIDLKKDNYILLFSFALIILIDKLNISIPINNISTFFLGIVDAISMVVPGISGTAIFIMLDCYDYILEIYSKISLDMIIFGFGITSGVIITSYVVGYFLKKHKNKFYTFTLGLLILSIIQMISFINLTFKDFIIGLPFFIIGFFISIFSLKKE